MITHAQTDQELVWGSYYGVVNQGIQLELIQDIAELPNGNFVILGRTQSFSGMSTAGAHQTSGNGGFECFLACFNEDRERLWASYFGGSGAEEPHGVEGMADGSFVICGSTNSASNIATTGAFQENIEDGYYNGFLSRFSGDGELLWSTYLGPPAGDSLAYSVIRDLVVTTNDDIVVVGQTYSPNFPVTENVVQPEYAGADAFISRFNSSGELVWSTFYGGPGLDQLSSVNVDSQGNIIGLGLTESEIGIATLGAHQTNYSGEGDMFVLKLTEAGNMIWSSYLGGDAEEDSNLGSVLTDSEDNIYISGLTESMSNIATPGAYQGDLLADESPYRNSMIGKFSPSGEYIWGSYFGSYGFTISSSLAIHSGKLIVAGYTYPPESSVIAGEPWQSDALNSSVNFLASFSLDGEKEWGTYYGGSGQDTPYSIKSFSDGTLAIAGYTNSDNGIETPDAFQPQNNGHDGFFSFFNINFGTGLSETENLALSVFPNPTTSHVRLQLPPEFAFQADIRIYNSVGQSISQIENFTSLNPLPMNHPPGLYVVEARNGNKVARSKVVVE